MNPFDLSGPQFLLFYSGLVLVLAGLLWIFRRFGEQAESSPAEVTDPYLVAYLRAGPGEVWRLATIRLIDRGMMKADGPTISVVAEAQSESVQNEVERATLDWFRTPRDGVSITKESTLEPVLRPYEERLMELGLLPHPVARLRSRVTFGLAAGVLVVVAVAKILIAQERERSNVAFLVVIALGGLFALYQLITPRRTRKGDAVLTDLKRLFSRLGDDPAAIKEGQSSAEAMWLAAVFGVGALSFSYVNEVYPKERPQGSSCGSSGGSSCGGGGGGCGGCGGCGG